MKKFILLMFSVILLVPLILAATGDIPANLPYDGSNGGSQPITFSLIEPNPLFALFFPAGGSPFTTNEDVEINLETNTFNTVVCDSTILAIEVYQNGKIVDAGSPINIGRTVGPKFISMGTDFGRLDAGTYGAVGYAYCGDSDNTICNNNCPTGSCSSDNLCTKAKASSKPPRISNIDNLDFQVNSPECTPNPPEVCNGIDDDCDGDVDELGACDSGCQDFAGQVCIGDNVYWTNTCGVTTSFANDCTSDNKICKPSGNFANCVDAPTGSGGTDSTGGSGTTPKVTGSPNILLTPGSFKLQRNVVNPGTELAVTFEVENTGDQTGDTFVEFAMYRSAIAGKVTGIDFSVLGREGIDLVNNCNAEGSFVTSAKIQSLKAGEKKTFVLNLIAPEQGAKLKDGTNNFELGNYIALVGLYQSCGGNYLTESGRGGRDETYDFDSVTLTTKSVESHLALFGDSCVRVNGPGKDECKSNGEFSETTCEKPLFGGACQDSRTKKEFKRATDAQLDNSLCSDTRNCNPRSGFEVECVKKEIAGIQSFDRSLPLILADALASIDEPGLCLATPLEDGGFDFNQELFEIGGVSVTLLMVLIAVGVLFLFGLMSGGRK